MDMAQMPESDGLFVSDRQPFFHKAVSVFLQTLKKISDAVLSLLPENHGCMGLPGFLSCFLAESTVWPLQMQ